MNKMPLPIHLITSIPGFRMMGQTAFGGYNKILWAWWENDCPDILAHRDEWLSLSGMRTSDYTRYKGRLEPFLIKTIEILKQYREERESKREHRLVNLRKAHAASRTKLLERKKVYKSKGNIVDRVTPVSSAPAEPTPQPFHEGWNLHKKNTPMKKPTYKGLLVDK